MLSSFPISIYFIFQGLEYPRDARNAPYGVLVAPVINSSWSSVLLICDSKSAWLATSLFSQWPSSTARTKYLSHFAISVHEFYLLGSKSRSTVSSSNSISPSPPVSSYPQQFGLPGRSFSGPIVSFHFHSWPWTRPSISLPPGNRRNF